MYLKDANYIALRRARVARCWKESVMGRRRTSSPATGGQMGRRRTSSPTTGGHRVARLQWVTGLGHGITRISPPTPKLPDPVKPAASFLPIPTALIRCQY
jgi:hypothetical protein